MGWGTSPGFAEPLSYTLRRPVDRLVQNDEGAFATRAMLRRDPDRLDRKRVVVYQFAARELAFGDCRHGPPEAEQEAVDRAEFELRRRAIEGWDQPVYGK